MAKHMKNYYEILCLEYDAPEPDIFKKYREKIKQFNCLPFLTTEMIHDIKLLKEAFYVLSDTQKRKIYKQKYKQYKESNLTNRIIDNTKICDRLFSITFT